MTDDTDRTSRPVRLSLSRRRALQWGLGLGAGGAASGLLGVGARAQAAGSGGTAAAPSIKLPGLLAPSEIEANEISAPAPPEGRLGFAIVGLGHLALNQILPAFGQTKYCRPVALVSGDRAKAEAVAAQYGVDSRSLYDYKTFDRLRDDPKVDIVYVVLPNSMHAEYTVRAAQAGKHVLCEKPMATSVADCQRMIEASRKAGKKLMVAYRLQYEPYNREAIRLARAGELGKLKSLRATNGQARGDPHQWRLRKALAGGGALPDVGIYCLNAARYLSGEEPTEVSATITTTPNDPRFTEVEEQVDFMLRFPSGFVASCTTSYGFHDSKEFRLIGSTGWLELDPAFPYKGQQMRIARKVSAGAVSAGAIEQRQLQAKDHFALEMDHLATRIREDKPPHTGGEEGLQDMRIIAALYDSARSGRRVALHAPAQKDAFRGPPPA